MAKSGLSEGAERSAALVEKVSYNSGFSAKAKSGVLEGVERSAALVEKLLQKMAARGLSPDRATYTAAITACERAADWEGAIRLLRQMQAERIEPDAAVYNVAIAACGRARRYERAAELFGELRSARGAAPTLVSYNALITAA